MGVALTKGHLVYMNMGELYWGATYSGLSPSQKKSVSKYVADIESYLSDGIGMFLWGDNDVGKTHIGAAMCKYVWGHYRVSSYLITASELKDAWIQDYPAHPDSEETVTQRISEVRFLVIDDLGKEHRAASGFAENKFGQLLRSRARKKLVTFITSNISPKAAEELYGRSTGRLIFEHTIPFELKGDSMRVKKVKKIKRRWNHATSDV